MKPKLTPWEAYREMSWTTANDECEECEETILDAEHYVEGEWGHYCSEECRDEVDDRMAMIPTDEEERAWERRQMGLSGF